jgi:ATP-binding cassette subfamily F protein 3
MSSADVAHQIRSTLPGTEEIIVDYLAGYLVDDAGEDEDVLQVTRDMLESFAGERKDALEELLRKLGEILEARINARERLRGPKLMKLEKAMEMGKTGSMSNTIALSEGVDLESINKTK